MVVRKEASIPARELAGAYGFLEYDLGVALKGEATWLADNGARLPEGWRALGDAPEVVRLVAGELRLGVVLFPESSKPGGSLQAEVAAAAQALHGDVDLVVGVSPWGEDAEKEFLTSNGAVFDLLLGAGRGRGSGMRLAAGGQTLWLRPVFDGWGVARLDILAKPGPEGGWREGQDYTFVVQWLDDKVAEDAQLARKLSWY